MPKQVITCWHCKLHGCNILDDFDCCKRCGTNLEKYPTHESHPYPEEIRREFGDEKLAAKVLGTRQKFTVPPEFDEYRNSNPPVKVNLLQYAVHWIDKDGERRQRFVDPLCSKCGKIAIHILTRTKDNETKIYRCKECYDINPEWRAYDNNK